MVLVPNLIRGKHSKLCCAVLSQPAPVPFHCPHPTPTSATFFSPGFCPPLILPQADPALLLSPGFQSLSLFLFLLCSSLCLSLQGFSVSGYCLGTCMVRGGTDTAKRDCLANVSPFPNIAGTPGTQEK